MSGIWAGMTQGRLSILLTGSPSTALSTWRGLSQRGSWVPSRSLRREPGWNCMTFCSWTLEHRASFENSKRLKVQPRFRWRELEPSEGGEALSRNRRARGRRCFCSHLYKTQSAMGVLWGCSVLKFQNLFLHQIIWLTPMQNQRDQFIRYCSDATETWLRPRISCQLVHNILP